MQKKIRAMLPHAAILIANMYIVFYVIDRFNMAMNFIDNALTKGLLLAMCVIVLCDMLLPRPKKRRGAEAKMAQASASPAPAHRPKHAAGSGGERP